MALFMSKLAERIRRASRTEPAPLGFAAAAARPKAPTLLTIVRLSSNEANKVPEAVSNGADIVLMEGIDASKVSDTAGKAGEALLGVQPDKVDRQRIAALRDAGADFVVLDSDSAPAEALLEEKVGFVLSLEAEPEDTTLRVLGELGLEALIVPAPASPFTVRQLLSLRRLSALAHTPLLTEVKHDAEASYLQALRDSGVAGVIVDSGAIGRLGNLRERIAALPARGRRREERADAVLPAGVGAASHDHEDDDDE